MLLCMIAVEIILIITAAGNHFRNAALRITFSLIPLIPPSRFRLISIHPEQLIFSVQLQSSVFSSLLYAALGW